MSKAGLLELNAVVAVATSRNFRGAASQLGMSPSALSHAVAAWKDVWGFGFSIAPREACR